jgi:hypothetical protein
LRHRASSRASEDLGRWIDVHRPASSTPLGRAEVEVDGELKRLHINALDRGGAEMAHVVPDEVEPPKRLRAGASRRPS